MMSEKIKREKSRKNPAARVLGILSVLLGTLALVLYLYGGRTQFDPNYSVRCIIALSAGIVLGIVAVIVVRREVFFLLYLTFLFGFFCYITSQLNLIANIFYDVDGSTVPTIFFEIAVSSAWACLLPLLICAFMPGKKRNKSVESAKEAE